MSTTTNIMLRFDDVPDEVLALIDSLTPAEFEDARQFAIAAAEMCIARVARAKATEIRARHTANSHRTLPPVYCAPWCVDHDGHPGATHQVDQWCGSEGQTVNVNYYPAVEQQDGSYTLERVTVFGMRRPSMQAWLQVTLGDIDLVQLAPDEARELAQALLVVAEVVTGDEPADVNNASVIPRH
jgi:hypothetical protein